MKNYIENILGCFVLSFIIFLAAYTVLDFWKEVKIKDFLLDVLIGGIFISTGSTIIFIANLLANKI